jgi:hypothetical protein
MAGKLHETLMESQKILNSLLEIDKVSFNDMEILRQLMQLFHCSRGLFGREIQAGSFFLVYSVRKI